MTTTTADISDAPKLAEKPRRTYMQQVLQDTLTRLGARFGLAWVVVAAALAIFAPFLANSLPLVMKTDQGIAFPLFRYLSAVDLILLVCTFAAIVLLCLRKISARTRWRILFAIGVVITPIAVTTVNPPDLVTAPGWPDKGYHIYRDMDKAGKIEWALYAPIAYSPTDRLRDQTGQRLLPPGAVHWLGTDSNNQDIASRIIHATRIALSIGFVATSIAVVVGVILGGIMGYFAGVIDLLGMRLIEIFQSIPQLLLLLILVATIDDRGPRMLYFMMVIIGLTSWPGYARFTRAEFLKLRKQDFVQAAIACGLSTRSILFRHLLPNGVAPVLVTASFGIASAIFIESTLSFLGLGLQDQPSWGQMLSEAIDAGGFYWWIGTFPGIAIFLTVFAYNLIGEALRDAIDPHTKKAKAL